MSTARPLKTDLSRYNNQWYKQPPLLKTVAWMITSSLFFRTTFPIPVSLKVLILRVFGATIGHNVMIKPSVNIKYPWLLSVGNHVWIGENVWIDNLAKVEIGDNSCLSQGSLILTGNHDFTKSTFDLKVGPVILEEGVWIGAKATVCPNVRCESHAVLTVGSVATKNLESFGIYRGNPATKIKERAIES